MDNRFSAKPSASGYLYQFQSALLLLLDSTEESSVSLEVLDDVSIERDGVPKDLIQLKLHKVREANLTDSSPDLWKTIRIWAEHLLAGRISLPEARLFLITTAVAQDGSIAKCLRREAVDRESVQSKLVEIAINSENNALKPAFNAFLALDSESRQDLINAIVVIDGAPGINDVRKAVRARLGLGIRAEHIDKVHQRIDGWWLEKVVAQLGDGAFPISRLEVVRKIADIADEYKSDSLPIEFRDAIPAAGISPGTDERLFVRQLREIGVSTKRLEKAILDYYRATEQRSKWIREDLIVDSELISYERCLIDEWERFSIACYEGLAETQKGDQKELERCGKKVFDHFDLAADIRIRPRVTAQYIMRGSFHILANNLPPQVYWCPNFLDKIKSLIEKAEKE